MATGITRRHSKGCSARGGGRCDCRAGWEAWVYLPREKAKLRRTFKRKAEAKSWRSDALALANQGMLRATKAETRTVTEALTAFTDGMADGTVRPRGRARYKPATIRSYEQASRVHLIPAIGRIKITDLWRADVQTLADELLGDGKAPSSVGNVLAPLQALFRRLQDRDEIAVNPTDRIDLPAQSSRRAKRIASPDEAAKLITAVPEADRVIWGCAFYGGLRRGELQALRCSDIDLAKSEIHVRRGWDQVEGEQAPKYDSVRRVPLLGRLRDFLDAHLLATGRSGDELIFGRTPTHAFAPMSIGKRARTAWTDAGLEPLTLHECRHTFASLLIDSGANPKAIQEFMGHKKITTTYDTYGHLLPGAQDEVRRRMDAYLAADDALTGARPGARPDQVQPEIASIGEQPA